ncbi:MAG: phosphoribosylanthranilate isomerase [Gemmatimonadales bacterium]|nr:phosphoribosylanthranilate isomerase [Gemmatimonadales bacterium]
MKPAGRTRVKICCMSSTEEVWMAIRHGASALGFVSAMPSGPGPIPDDTLRRIAGVVPPGIATFLLTSRQDATAIIAQQRKLRLNTVQICDRLLIGTHRDLKRALPGVAIVQVIHVSGERSLMEAAEVAPHVDAILLDSGNQDLAVKELGGTGRTHDWSVSRRIRELVDGPVWLAGGLNANNVAEAIGAVEPFGVDLCSGVRTDGRLDEEKLKAFTDAVERANRR